MMKFWGYHLSRPFVFLLSGIAVCSIALFVVMPTLVQASNSPFLANLHTFRTIASTVPTNGDVNPYGTFVVPKNHGNLVRGNVLVSNFNNSGNLQGTGTTIVQITPGGTVLLFAQLSANQLHGSCPGGVGLTTALVVLKRGWVIVGSLPTKDGTATTAKAGCLIVLNSEGQAVETFSGGPINGPWDMTVADYANHAALFVTNVLNGTVAGSGNVVNKGTVLRIMLDVPQQGWGIPHIDSTSIIGSGFSEKTDPNALVIGPTGVGLDHNGTLYVADTLNNRIAAIPNALNRQNSALTGKDVTANGSLNGPLGLTIAPDGDILTVNSGDGNIVETTPKGMQVFTKQLELASMNNAPLVAGDLFGLAVDADRDAVYFVDDGSNTLNTLY